MPPSFYTHTVPGGCLTNSELEPYIVDGYVNMRSASASWGTSGNGHTYATARSLLGILRLSQALVNICLFGFMNTSGGPHELWPFLYLCVY